MKKGGFVYEEGSKTGFNCTFGRDGGNWYGKHFSTGRL